MSQSPVSSRSWRKRAGTETSKGVRASQIALMFVLIGGLTALFIWLAWPNERLKPYVHVFYVPDYHLTELPPLDYVQDDIDQLGEHFSVDDESGDGGVRSFQVTEPNTARGMSDILSDLQRQFENVGERGVAMIYVGAHGFSANGKGYLLGSNSEIRDHKNLCPVEDLVETVNALDANVKILLIDAGRIQSDLRAGMAVNEFPFRLHEAVKDCEADNLWVICSHSLMQVSHPSHSRKRSVFGWAVTEAFQNLGNMSEGSKSEITLDAFYRYVLDHCATYTQINGNAVQTPLLMRGGLGYVNESTWKDMDDETKNTVLFFRDQIEVIESDDEQASLSRFPRDQQLAVHRTPSLPIASSLAMGSRIMGVVSRHQDDDKKNDDKKSEQEKAKDSGKDKDNDTDKDNKTDANQPPTAPSPKREFDLQKKLEGNSDYESMNATQKSMLRIWLLRDWIQSRDEQLQHFSPVDFAPNLWQRLNLELIALSRQVHIHGDSLSQNHQLRLSELESGLQELLDVMKAERRRATSGSGSGDIEDLLLRAWNNSSPESASASGNWSKGDLEKIGEIKRAIRSYRDIAFRARYYAKWFTGRSISNQTDPAKSISALFEALHSSQSQFEITDLKVSDASWNRMLRASNRLRTLEAEAFESLRQSYLRARRDALGQFESEFILNRLLDSPLIGFEDDQFASDDAQTRLNRLSLLNQFNKVAEHKSDFRRYQQSWPTLEPTSQSKSALSQRLAVASCIFMLDQSESYDRVKSAVGNTGNGSGISGELSSFDSVNEQWKNQLSSLFETIKNVSVDAKPDHQRWRLASLVDARDLQQIEHIDRYAVPGVRFLENPIAEKIQFSSASAGTVALDDHDIAKIEVQVTSRARQLRIGVEEFEPRLVRIWHNGNELKPGDEFLVNINAGIASFDLKIAAQSGVDKSHIPAGLSSAPEIRISAEGETAFDDCVFDVELPLPNRIDVEVRQLNWKQPDDRIVISNEDRNLLTLMSFPNTDSHFEFFLHNRSGKSRTVIAEYWLVDLPDSFEMAIGRVSGKQSQVSPTIRQFMTTAIRDGSARLLAKSGETSLGAASGGDSTKPVRFAKPEAPKAKDGEGDEAAPKKDDKPSPQNSNQGLVLRYVEKVGDQFRARNELVWFEIGRVFSESMVIPEHKFNRTTGRFEVAMSVQHDQLLLNRGLKKIQCTIHCDKQFKITAPKADLTDQLKRKELAVNLPTGLGAKGTVPVTIAVNGVPRALIYEVNIETGSVSEVRRGKTGVNIHHILALDEDDKEVESARYFSDVWGVSRAEKFVVDLHADLPFENPEGDITLTFLRNQSSNPVTRRFKNDREIAYTALVQNDQFLVINSKISDHKVTFYDGGSISKATLMAKASSDRDQAEAAQKLVFDPSPPRALSFRFKDGDTNAVIKQGEPLEVVLKLEDDGIGIDPRSVKIGLDEDNSGDIAPGEYKATRTDGTGVFTRKVISTGKLEAGQRVEVRAIAKDRLDNLNDEIGPIFVDVLKGEDKEKHGTGNGSNDNNSSNDNNDNNENKVEKPKTYDITIRVKHGTRPLSGDAEATVVIEGPKKKSKKVSGGMVKFKNLPAGEYKVNAKGRSASFKKIEADESTIEVGPDETKFEITLNTK